MCYTYIYLLVQVFFYHMKYNIYVENNNKRNDKYMHCLEHIINRKIKQLSEYIVFLLISQNNGRRTFVLFFLKIINNLFSSYTPSNETIL